MTSFVQNPEHFRDALTFSKTLPRSSRKTLLKSISRLNRIKRHASKERGRKVRLSLYPDFVAHSWLFSFSYVDTGHPCIFSGGLILHGFQETFSVEINPVNFPHWSIHT